MSVTKHITQGGQVFSYMLNMFMQVNRRIAFWLCNLFILLVPFIFWLRVPWQEICNGALYWWLSVTAKGEHALFRVPPVYAVRYEGQILHFTSGAILHDPYMTYTGQLVMQELGIAVLLASLVVLVAGYGVYYWLKRLGANQAQDVQTGGRTLTENVKSVTRMLHQSGNASTLHIDQLSLVRDSELKNLLLHGTPGSGKSNALNKLLRQLRARGDRVVVYDKGCSLVKRHYNPTTDSLLNPLDRRCEYWDLWLECQSTPDYDSIANTLIPQGTREDPFWTGAARTIFTAVSARLKNDPQRTYNRLLRTLLAINLEALREYVAGTEASNLMEEKVEKTAISIRGVLTNYVKALRYMQGIEHTGRPRFAIREWMTRVNEPGQPRGWLWITSNARQHTSLKPLISMWLAQAANCLLEMGENSNRRVWFIFDELTSLHKLPELPLVLSEARKFGGCFVLGFQNKPQLDFTYGKDFADAMMDLLNTRFFFRSPDEGVASYVMRQLGQRRARIFSEQYSYGADTVRDGVSFSKQEEDRYLVNYSDIQSLPDLSCFVTLPGQYPVVRMNMRYEDLDTIAPEFLPRELNDSLDQEIDAEIRSRDLENERVMRLLSSLEDGSGEAVTAGCTCGTDHPASADDAVGKQAVPEGLIVEKMTGERGRRPEQERTGLPAAHALRASEQHLLTHSRSDNTPPGDDW